MLLGSFILGLDYKNAYKIYKRDKNKSSSPNSCKTESVAAGALDVELLGDAYYFGKLVKKETIGDNIKEIEIDHIKTMNKLMYVTAVLSLIIFSSIRFFIKLRN